MGTTRGHIPLRRQDQGRPWLTELEKTPSREVRETSFPSWSVIATVQMSPAQENQAKAFTTNPKEDTGSGSSFAAEVVRLLKCYHLAFKGSPAVDVPIWMGSEVWGYQTSKVFRARWERSCGSCWVWGSENTVAPAS